jgi:aryl-alcohol dehydrogenase-like predicted oxidoreductase
MNINFIDTSADYADSEEKLGWALNELGNPPCVICTKLGPRSGERDFDPQNKEMLRATVEQSLRLLHRDTLDILMIHEPDRPGQFNWFDDGISFHGPVTELLSDLKREGLIRYIGIGGTTVYELTRIVATGEYDVVLTAFNSSLLWRDALTTVIPEAQKQEAGIVLGSPTQQGWLAARYDDEIENGAPWLSPPRRRQLKALYALVDEIGIDLPVLSLRWALSIGGVSTILTGPRTVAQLEQNYQAVRQGPLPADILSRLDEIAEMLPHRPFEEPAGCKFGKNNYWGPGPLVY